MGRKIPSKKHRGVKDPLIQQAKRLQELKGKINAPPKDPDDQPVPKSLTQLFAFENQIKDKSINLKKKKKKYPKADRDNIRTQNDNPITNLRKLPGETGRSFTMRINSAMKAIQTVTSQDDYPLDIEAEDSKGEQMALQRARRKKKRNKAMATAGEQPHTKLTRAQKLALKKKAKVEKALEREAGDEVRRERVEFGEVAHAPPALSVRPRRAPLAPLAERRPGRKELLLSGLLRPGAGAGAGADAERRERARLEAVAAYRALRGRPAPPSAHTLVHL